MVNILTKIIVFILFFINLCSPIVESKDKNIKQCFYNIEDGKSLSEDLLILSERKIPTFVIIDPYEKLDKVTLNLLEKYQEDDGLKIVLKNHAKLEKSRFVIKEYNKNLSISGIVDVESNKLVYTGAENISFYVIKVDSDPLETMTKVNELQKDKSNYALLVDEGSFDLSNLLLVYSEIKGEPLEISDYSFKFKEKPKIYNVFTYVGNVTIILFSISIAVFILAIIIFRKWSMKKFLD